MSVESRLKCLEKKVYDINGKLNWLLGAVLGTGALTIISSIIIYAITRGGN